MASGRLEEALVNELNNYAELTALVGDRISAFNKAKGEVLPCVTYVLVSAPYIKTKDSKGKNGDLVRNRFQFDCWGRAEDYDNLVAANEALRNCLNGFQGTLGSTTTKSNVFAIIDNEVPEYDEETKIYRIRSEYLIWAQS